jgi:hypothetical protein
MYLVAEAFLGAGLAERSMRLTCIQPVKIGLSLSLRSFRQARLINSLKLLPHNFLALGKGAVVKLA